MCGDRIDLCPFRYGTCVANWALSGGRQSAARDLPGRRTSAGPGRAGLARHLQGCTRAANTYNVATTRAEMSAPLFYAQGGTRTPMPERALPPQGSTSTNFATCATIAVYSLFDSAPTSIATGSLPSRTSASAAASSFSSAAMLPPIMRVWRSWRRTSRATFSRMK